MSTFIFVHGAWHGGWCWEKVAPLLRAASHEVFASDLQGDDPTLIDGLTLGDWIDSVSGLIESRPDEVVLVVQPAGRRIVWPLCNSRPLQVYWAPGNKCANPAGQLHPRVIGRRLARQK
jgi:hypothetical protein